MLIACVTNDANHVPGDVIGFPDDEAKRFIVAGYAEPVTEPVTEPKKIPVPAPKVPSKKGS
jgi:hypothetical protein